MGIHFLLSRHSVVGNLDTVLMRLEHCLSSVISSPQRRKGTLVVTSSGIDRVDISQAHLRSRLSPVIIVTWEATEGIFGGGVRDT